MPEKHEKDLILGAMKLGKNWKKSKSKVDPYMPMVKAALGQVIINIGEKIEDQKEMTDLKILGTGKKRIGVRVRNPYSENNPNLDIYENFGDEITIRIKRQRRKTELQKIMEGWGDIYFYGIGDKNQSKFKTFTIFDLDGLRQLYNHKGKEIFHAKHWNKDHSSKLGAMKIKLLDSKYILRYKDFYGRWNLLGGE